jgi:hypothetical protein
MPPGLSKAVTEQLTKGFPRPASGLSPEAGAICSGRAETQVNSNKVSSLPKGILRDGQRLLPKAGVLTALVEACYIQKSIADLGGPNLAQTLSRQPTDLTLAGRPHRRSGYIRPLRQSR